MRWWTRSQGCQALLWASRAPKRSGKQQLGEIGGFQGVCAWWVSERGVLYAQISGG